MRQTTALWISAVFALCCSTAAVSTALADGPARAYSWTGFYVGVHDGYGATSISGTGPRGSAAGVQQGFIAGSQLGYNYQFQSYVIGLEGDLSWSWVEVQAATSGGKVIIKDNYFATIAPRFGYAFDRVTILGRTFDSVLIYGKAGIAFTQEDWRLTSLGSVATGTFDRTGWMLGAGAEYALWDNWSFKFEYNYLNFSSIHEELHRSGGAPVIIGDVKASPNLFKFGINYHF